jgi:hypothetical protein
VGAFIAGGSGMGRLGGREGLTGILTVQEHADKLTLVLADCLAQLIGHHTRCSAAFQGALVDPEFHILAV